MNTLIQTIVTPKKFILNGLYLGPKNAENIFIYLHGLSGNLFKQNDLHKKLVSKKSAVLTFNNRGYGVINKIKQIDKKEAGSYLSHLFGTAHEVFTDCLDDIEGAINCVKDLGAKNIFLIGHSTGCQKSIYYLAKKKNPLVKGAILLAPMSDFADVKAFVGKQVYNKALAQAKKMVDNNQAHELMPKSIWPYVTDAQRFLSLHTAESVEEIFCYASAKDPKILKSVTCPLLVVLAEEDEFKDRPMSEIGDWFKKNIRAKNTQIRIISKSTHSFEGFVDELANLIKTWRKKSA